MNSKLQQNLISSTGISLLQKSALFQSSFKEKHTISKGKKIKKKCFWTLQEDELLREQVERYGCKQWSKISKKLKNRQPKRCRQRWFNYLANQNKSNQEIDEEQWPVFVCYKYLGNKWSSIGKILKRGDIIVKNKINSLKRNKGKLQKFQGKILQIITKMSSQNIIYDNIQQPSLDRLNELRLKQKIIFQILALTLNTKSNQFTDMSVKLQQDVQINSSANLHISHNASRIANQNWQLQSKQISKQSQSQCQKIKLYQLQQKDNKQIIQQRQQFMIDFPHFQQNQRQGSSLIQKMQFQPNYTQLQNPFWINTYQYQYPIGFNFWFIPQ